MSDTIRDWEIKYVEHNPDKGKISDGKLEYELDFEFITDMAKRMKIGKKQYKPYSWQNPIDIKELKQGLFRHCLAVMKNEYADEEQEFGHLYAIAVNAMFINYQLKNGSKTISTSS
jgi:hypothetical protein